MQSNEGTRQFLKDIICREIGTFASKTGFSKGKELSLFTSWTVLSKLIKVSVQVVTLHYLCYKVYKSLQPSKYLTSTHYFAILSKLGSVTEFDKSIFWETSEMICVGSIFWRTCFIAYSWSPSLNHSLLHRPNTFVIKCKAFLYICDYLLKLSRLAMFHIHVYVYGIQPKRHLIKEIKWSTCMCESILDRQLKPVQYQTSSSVLLNCFTWITTTNYIPV